MPASEPPRSRHAPATRSATNAPARTTPTAAAPGRVLVVAPDEHVRRWAALCLQVHGHDVHDTADADAIETAHQNGHDLLLMDPDARAQRGTRHGLDAWQRLRGLRDRCPTLPVIVLQAHGGPTDRTAAFERGADAVIDHPFDPRELRARVARLLNLARFRPTADSPPTPDPQDEPLQVGGWWLNPVTRQLHTPTGLRVQVSEPEMRLLRAFLRAPHSALGRDHLLALVSDGGSGTRDTTADTPDTTLNAASTAARTVDMMVSRLRQKLHDNPQAPRVIQTVRGVGYLFEAGDGPRDC